MPFAVFWMRAHFVNMPSEITEAARVDGASTWDLFWRIHVPLARPPIASLGILMSVWTWNQFLLALVLVEDPTQRTMAGALGAFQGHYATDIPLLCAGTILILLPDADRLRPLPAPGHRRAAPGFGEGMTSPGLRGLRSVRVHGDVDDGYGPVVDAFADNFAERDDLGAACAVYVDGRPVVDIWGGVADARTGRTWDADTAAVIFSCSKGMLAICAYLLVQEGRLDLDAPVARYWPAFGAHGKEATTVRGCSVIAPDCPSSIGT